MGELTMIAHTEGAGANTVAPDRAHASIDPETQKLMETPQSERKVKPVTLSVDPVSNKIRAVCAIPLVKIDGDESTLFTSLLGYTTYSDESAAADPVTGLIPPSPQSMLQLPPLDRPGSWP